MGGTKAGHQLAGKEAEERPQVERFYTKSKPRGGVAIKLIALAIIIDNLAES